MTQEEFTKQLLELLSKDSKYEIKERTHRDFQIFYIKTEHNNIYEVAIYFMGKHCAVKIYSTTLHEILPIFNPPDYTIIYKMFDYVRHTDVGTYHCNHVGWVVEAVKAIIIQSEERDIFLQQQLLQQGSIT